MITAGFATGSAATQTLRPIQILVVDDSAVIRELLIQMLQGEPGFDVIGAAQDGREAIQMTAALHPDVVTMDLYMPQMNGLVAIRHIMKYTPTPIAVVAADVHEDSADMAAQAIAAGALAVVEKPYGISPVDYDTVRGQLVTAIRLIAGVQLVTLLSRDMGSLLSEERRQAKVVAIGASTGGPGILQCILSALSGDLAVPIVIVQHITAGFDAGFVRWLDSVTDISVRLAQDNEPLQTGSALIAPEGQHLTLQAGGIVRLDTTEPVGGARPSATRLFDSVAQVYQDTGVGILLTGMGDDGAEGLEKLWRAGGYTIAQDEASCVVFSMPESAITRGIVRQVLSPDEIAAFLMRLNGAGSVVALGMLK